MLRIIGGTCRGRKLLAPEGLDTRPTMDRVRVTIFDILQFDVRGARVLDLYGGSGAMALEALSRGAQSAVIAEIDRNAQRVISANTEALRLSEKTTLLRMSDRQALERLSGRQFDIIFLDPPYRMDLTDVLAALAAGGQIGPRTLVVCEYSQLEPRAGSCFECVKERHFAQTHVRIYRLKEGEEHESSLHGQL